MSQEVKCQVSLISFVTIHTIKKFQVKCLIGVFLLQVFKLVKLQEIHLAVQLERSSIISDTLNFVDEVLTKFNIACLKIVETLWGKVKNQKQFFKNWPTSEWLQKCTTVICFQCVWLNWEFFCFSYRHKGWDKMEVKLLRALTAVARMEF